MRVLYKLDNRVVVLYTVLQSNTRKNRNSEHPPRYNEVLVLNTKSNLPTDFTKVVYNSTTRLSNLPFCQNFDIFYSDFYCIKKKIVQRNLVTIKIFLYD